MTKFNAISKLSCKIPNIYAECACLIELQIPISFHVGDEDDEGTEGRANRKIIELWIKIIMKNDLSSVTQIAGISDSARAEACYNVKWDRQRCSKYKQITMPGDTVAKWENKQWVGSPFPW